MQCAICNSELEEESYTEEIWGSFDIVEVHQKCNKCKLYEYEYVYGNSCRWIYKRMICDEKEHKLYIKLIRFLWKLGVIANDNTRNKTNEFYRHTRQNKNKIHTDTE